jgi:hypothetical protein
VNKTVQEVASAWIEKWSSPNPATGIENVDLDFDLPRENPSLCLDAILEILKTIPTDTSNHHFQVLAAGPLEDLLVNHGETYVEGIEALARKRPDFRLLLNGVWDGSIKPSVIKQLAKYMDNKW